ncbi:MAG: ABC transporter permease [Salibacteraceae bacterium]
MNKTWIIALREYSTRVRKKSFILMSILGPVLMAGVVLFSIWIGREEDQHHRILVVDDNYPLFTNLKDTRWVDYEFADIKLDDALAELDREETAYTAVMYLPKNILNSGLGQLFFTKQPAFRIVRLIEEQIQQYIEIEKIKSLNISETDYRRLKTPFTLQTLKYDTQFKSISETDVLPAVVGLGFSVLIYLFIFMYSVMVMRGVIEEKANRIVEVIISSVKPFQLMAGKILGVGAVGLTQFVVWVVLSVILVAIGSTTLIDSRYNASTVFTEVNMSEELKKELSGDTFQEEVAALSNPDSIINQISRINWPLMIGFFIFYFLGGYLLYSSMMAAIGSAVDNDTDTQQFVLPVTFPLLLSYAAAFGVFENPSGDTAVWLSIIPFTSPVIMILRIAIGIESGDLWQVYLSAALLVVTILAMTWLAARIYRTGILLYGKKASLREIARWISHP